MFEYFEKLDDALSKRYRTLETNLSACSNSFFDSYREVVQDFLLFVKRREHFEVSQGKNENLSPMLSGGETYDFLMEIGTTADVLKKVKNYVLKTNKHIHEKEKELTFELTVDYLRSLYQLTAPYAQHVGISAKEPSINDIQALYSQYQINEKAFSMVKNIGAMLAEKDEEPDEDAVHETTPSERYRRSAKEYIGYTCRPNVFLLRARIVFILGVLSVLTAIAASIVSRLFYGNLYYYIYLAPVHIWTVTTLVILLKTLFIKPYYPRDAFNRHTIVDVYRSPNILGSFCLTKRRYDIVCWIAHAWVIIWFLLNLLLGDSLWTQYRRPHLANAYIVFMLLYFVIAFVAYKAAKRFYESFDSVVLRADTPDSRTGATTHLLLGPHEFYPIQDFKLWANYKTIFSKKSE